MIRLEKVTKYFQTKTGRKYIMKDVCLDIPSGVNIGILGLNGAGKSTLLKMVGGIDFPNSGKIESDMNLSWPLSLTGGFQGSLTGKENAKLICRLYSKTDKDVKRALDFIFEFSELGDYFAMPVKTYSSGMRARLGFAMSLAFDFDCYLIDEILSVGDKKFKKKCMSAFNDLTVKRCIMLVSHNTKVLKKMCNAGIVLENGELNYFEDMDNAVKYYQSQL
ncbi:MAG: ABC transporter ATP-binding protein [Desulfobacteraceae bacterium]|nr:ABC transporter ATP-binding protein [Desulfobacteraceae bacterium]